MNREMAILQCYYALHNMLADIDGNFVKIFKTHFKLIFTFDKGAFFVMGIDNLSF